MGLEIGRSWFLADVYPVCLYSLSCPLPAGNWTTGTRRGSCGVIVVQESLVSINNYLSRNSTQRFQRFKKSPLGMCQWEHLVGLPHWFFAPSTIGLLGYSVGDIPTLRKPTKMMSFTIIFAVRNVRFFGIFVACGSTRTTTLESGKMIWGFMPEWMTARKNTSAWECFFLPVLLSFHQLQDFYTSIVVLWRMYHADHHLLFGLPGNFHCGEH